VLCGDHRAGRKRPQPAYIWNNGRNRWEINGAWVNECDGIYERITGHAHYIRQPKNTGHGGVRAGSGQRKGRGKRVYALPSVCGSDVIDVVGVS